MALWSFQNDFNINNVFMSFLKRIHFFTGRAILISWLLIFPKRMYSFQEAIEDR